ncbi:MAG TPA: FAD-dependent oxidoreductase [Hanamia sp.]|nr:FAD-dependent oxidoreductase [Hanamia sp.]
MFSYWEQQSFTFYDHIIVGAGIVGLSTAIELKERFPMASVLVLERDLLPASASSRNAGFACMGSVTELLDDLTVMKETEVFNLFEWRKRGLEKLRKRLGDINIGYAERGSYELINDKETGALDSIAYLNKLLQPITQKPAFRLVNTKIDEFGFSKDHTKALIENTCEGELHTGKMLKALTGHALRAGIEIKTGAEVINFTDDASYVFIKIKVPFTNKALILHSRSLVLCTNAFTKELLPAEDVRPGRGQVLVTQPIRGLKFKGIFHFDKGYYYFREIDGRVLLGGGRHLDFEGETTTDPGLNETIQLDLEKKLKEIILPGIPFSIERRWSGIMAFGSTKYPIVKAFSPKVFGAFRMGGMGVALGSEVASQVADLVAENISS